MTHPWFFLLSLKLPEDFAVVFGEAEGELAVGGVFLRIFIAQPAWVLRKPREFLIALLEKLTELLEKNNPHVSISHQQNTWKSLLNIPVTFLSKPCPHWPGGIGSRARTLSNMCMAQSLSSYTAWKQNLRIAAAFEFRCACWAWVCESACVYCVCGGVQMCACLCVFASHDHL